MEEVVELHTQTVVQQIALQTDVELLGAFPLNLVITHIGELCTDGSGIIADRGIAGTRCIIADTVVTAHVEAGIQAKIVDKACLGEPAFVGHHPAQLNAGEQSPFYAKQFQSVGILTETAVCLAHQRYGSEIAVHVVIVYITIPLNLLPLVVSTLNIAESIPS